jgi:hypothetical protein
MKDLKIGYSWIKVVLMEAIIWNLVDFKGQKTRMNEMEVNQSLVMIVEDQIQRRKYLVVSMWYLMLDNQQVHQEYNSETITASIKIYKLINIQQNLYNLK